MLETIAIVEETVPWLMPVFAFVLGACVGSFLNVCIYRIPAGLSVVKPGSRCPHCGTPIKPWQNVPVLGWVLLRGKARCCGKPISARYPFVEALTGTLFALSWWLLPPLLALCGMLLCAMMVAVTFIDLDTLEIPDRFSIGGMLVGCLLALLLPELHGHTSPFPAIANIRSLISALVGAFVGSASVMWMALIMEKILRKEAMGFGDVKLMGAIGAFCGWQGALFAIFGGAVIGIVLTLIFKLMGYVPGQNASHEPTADHTTAMEEDVPEGAIPFGPALAAAAVLYFLWAYQFVDTELAIVYDQLYG